VLFLKRAAMEVGRYGTKFRRRAIKLDQAAQMMIIDILLDSFQHAFLGGPGGLVEQASGATRNRLIMGAASRSTAQNDDNDNEKEDKVTGKHAARGIIVDDVLLGARLFVPRVHVARRSRLSRKEV
jgi:hypothetical protein